MWTLSWSLSKVILRCTVSETLKKNKFNFISLPLKYRGSWSETHTKGGKTDTTGRRDTHVCIFTDRETNLSTVKITMMIVSR